MDGHRRYAEDPDPAWYSRPAPYESGVPERRPDEEPRYPLTGGVESLAPADPYPPGDRYDGAGYAVPYQPVGGHAADPLTATGSFSRDAPVDEPPAETPVRPALDAIRVPLRATEYPAVRPGGSTGERPTTSTGGHGVTAAPDGPGAGRSAGLDGPGPGLDGRSAGLDGRSAGLDGRGAGLDGRSAGGVPGQAYPGVPSSGVPSSGGPSSGVPSSGVPSSAAPTSPAYNEPTSFVPPVGVRTADGPAAAEHGGSGRSVGDGIYRTRRPVSAVIFALLTAALMIPVIRLLIDVALADRPTAAGIVPAVLMTLGLPLTGVGLYSVAAAGRTIDRGAWLRPPAGYLLVGLALLAAAALATR